MKHQRRFVTATALVLCAATALFLCLRTRKEPTWQGKTYSQWFAEFRQAKMRHRQTTQSWMMMPGSSKFTLATGYYDDIEGLLRDPSADALRAMGTNIVPFLVAEIRHEDSGLLKVYRSWYFKPSFPLKRFAPKPPVSRDEIRGDASLALAALRRDAAAAVPAVFQAFATATPMARIQFEESLRRLPFDSIAFDAALQTMVKRGETYPAVSAIARFGVWNPNTARILTNAVFSTNAPTTEAALGQLRYCRRYAALALPALRLALTSSNQQTRWSVASLLEAYGSDAAEALPDLIQASKSDDDEMRYRAVRAIESMGTNALAAALALAVATNDSSIIVRSRAARILQNLKEGGTNE